MLDGLIRKGLPVNFHLTEGRDILAIPVAHDANAIIVRGSGAGDHAILYKRAIAAITPSGGIHVNPEGVL